MIEAEFDRRDFLAASAVAASALATPDTADAQGAIATVKAVPLTEMAKNARHAFVGTVEHVADVRLNKLGISLPARSTRFKLSHILKGDLKNGGTFTSTMYAGRFPKPGDELLWYLPEESRLGLASPIGIASGHFEISRRRDKQQLATNLLGNMGVWKGKSLFDDHPVLTRESLAAELRRQGVDDKKIKEMLGRADMPSGGQPIHLELLTAATHLLVRELDVDKEPND